jgi:hypothetical protein
MHSTLREGSLGLIIRAFKKINCIRILLFFVLFFVNKLGLSQVSSFKLNQRQTTISKGIGEVKNPDTSSHEKKIYRTADVLRYLYQTKTIEEKKAELKKIKDEIYSDTQSPVSSFKREEKLKKIGDLEVEIYEATKMADSLYSSYLKDYIQYRNFNFFLGPKRAKAFFSMAYDGNGNMLKPLNNAGVSFGANTGGLYSEIVSGNMALLRVTLGTMVSKSGNDDPDAEKQEEAYQRLVSYGGNTVLTFEYPFAYVHSNDNRYNFIGRLLTKGTADFPAFGTTSDKWAGSASYGFDLYADATLSNKKMRFFGHMNFARYHGTSVFKDNLGLSQYNFNFGQLTFGMVFLDNFKLSFVVSTISNDAILKNKNVIASGQVLR